MVRYLNVGSNRAHLDGFVNIDIEPIADVCCDVRWNLPFADGAFDGVYSEHFIEHVPMADAVAFLRECRRVTRPGGRIRVATPDLDWIVDRYRSDDWRQGDMFANGYDWVTTRAEQMNVAMRHWGHQWLYDEVELRRIGAAAGLRALGRCTPGESDLACFRGLETRPGSRLVIEFSADRPAVRTDRPLVSVLIPAWRDTYLDEAIASASAQTWDELEIVVGDDSPDGSRVPEIVAAWAARDPRVRYQRNPEPRGARANYYRLFATSTGDYVKYLNDDDLLHPRAVEQMASVLSSHPSVSLVTSHRRRIDSTGAPLGDVGPTMAPVTDDAVIDGPSAAHAAIAPGVNWIGEPTTTMFRRSDITDDEPELFAFGGRAARANGDVTLWTRLLARGDLAYLATDLSRFRQHDDQAQSDPAFRARGLAGWEQLRFDAERLGLLGPARRTMRARAIDLRPWWPESARELVLAADDLLSAGRAEEALSALGRARIAGGSDTALASLEAGLAEAMGDVERALGALRAAAETDPTDARAHFTGARVLVGAGRIPEAQVWLEQGLALSPGDRAAVEIHHAIGSVRIAVA